MGWWFGRKSAPADARPFVPAWLSTDSAEEGFARSIDRLAVYVKSSGCWATYRSGAWEFGQLRGSALVLDGQQVVGSRSLAINSPTGGATVDAEARAVISEILASLRHHGLIDL